MNEIEPKIIPTLWEVYCTGKTLLE